MWFYLSKLNSTSTRRSAVEGIPSVVACTKLKGTNAEAETAHSMMVLGFRISHHQVHSPSSPLKLKYKGQSACDRYGLFESRPTRPNRLGLQDQDFALMIINAGFLRLLAYTIHLLPILLVLTTLFSLPSLTKRGAMMHLRLPTPASRFPIGGDECKTVDQFPRRQLRLYADSPKHPACPTLQHLVGDR